MENQHSFKIFKNRLGVNIGGVGSLRDLNIISTSDEEWISENDILKNNINFKSIVRDTVPKFFKELDSFNRLYKDKGMEEMNSAFVLAHNMDCFLIHPDGCVEELVDMFAIGSGSDIAESAYAVLRDTELSAKEKAIRSVVVSCERDLYVGYPIVVTNTKMESFEIFDGMNFYSVNEDGELVSIEEDGEITEEERAEACKNCYYGETVEDEDGEDVTDDE